MPAYWKPVGQRKRAHNFWRLAIAFAFFLTNGSKALGETLVNVDGQIKTVRITSNSGTDDDSSVARASVAVPEFTLQATPADHTVTWAPSRILQEVGKQAIDQPGHFLIGAAPIWASRYLVGVPWLGWVAAPILAYREWLQWPSKRWWDPPLDWAFLTLGALAATVSRRPGLGVASGFAAIRQSVALGLAIRGRMRHAG